MEVIFAAYESARTNPMRVLFAENGREGVTKLRETSDVDLVLLDVMMPEMDGFETCRRIKASTAWREIPIIFLTAKTDTADIVRGFELGAVDYVAKPRVRQPPRSGSFARGHSRHGMLECRFPRLHRPRLARTLDLLR